MDREIGTLSTVKLAEVFGNTVVVMKKNPLKSGEMPVHPWYLKIGKSAVMLNDSAMQKWLADNANISSPGSRIEEKNQVDIEEEILKESASAGAKTPTKTEEETPRQVVKNRFFNS